MFGVAMDIHFIQDRVDEFIAKFYSDLNSNTGWGRRLETNW